LALLKSPQPLPNDAVPTILVNDLAGLDSDLVLVLDDYHAIQNGSVHAALSFLLDHLPDKLHIVVSTRVDPPWPLARFRARNQLIEVRAQDLRFTTEEAAAFLNQVMGLNLSTDDVAALEARTEGWVAGLQLAALSMKGRSDIAGFVKAFTGSHAYVAEYLVEEVLQRQAEDVQTFLVQTSILERLNAALCEAVTGRQDGQARLMALHRANLFVIPLDDVGQWFRYHHLFADLLQARMGHIMLPDAVADLHRRAAAWYEQNGFANEAVNHALAAKDFDGAARLVEQNAYPIVTRGELATLLQWSKALPDDVTKRRPLSLLAKAWALTFAGAIEQVEPLLQLAEAQIKIDSETPIAREVLGNAAAMRAYLAMMTGDDSHSLEFAERAEALLPESSVQPRSFLAYTLGMAYRGQGNYEKAAEAFAREVQMGAASGDLLTWATGTVEVANTRRLQGRLREAGEMCRQALRRIAEQEVNQFGSLAKVDIALGEVLREQNELDEARTRVTDALARMQAWDMLTDQLFTYLTLIHIQESLGDFVGAFKTLRTAKDLKATHPVFGSLARLLDLHEIRLSLATHDIAAAERLMDGLQPGMSRMVFTREQELITLARLRLAQGRPDEATIILYPLATEAEAAGRKGSLLEILALQACTLQAQGDQDASVTVLTKALVLAEPEGFVRVFVDEGDVMQQLLATVASQPAPASDQASIPLKTYVSKLLDAFQGSPSSGVALRSQDKVAGLVEPLTSRELEVLRLIATGDSNQTIADKLVITVSAVKKHTGNIFGKLNVNSRTQALARARQLGLLPADR
jgi:LuxR family maltose regulon positive regulatory protein